MVNSVDINSILLSLIYKISSLKTEEDLINKATPDILKKFNCFAGVVISFVNNEEKIIIPKNFIKNPKWVSLKQQILRTFQQEPFDKIEIIEDEDNFYYAFRLSKYGLLILGSSKRFDEGLFHEMYNLAEYFGKNLTNAIYELERAEKDKIIAQQIQLQNFLIEISSKYINADLSDLNGMINQSLKQMGEFVEADRSYIFDYDFVKNTTSNTHEWCANGIEPEIHNLQDTPLEFIPQWLEFHKKGAAFYVEDVKLLPDDGEYGLRAILEPQGIQSLIAIPMIKADELIGFVGFDSVKKKHNYSDSEKNILFVFSNMLVNVMQRKENEEQIKEQEAKKEILLQNLEKQNKELNDYAHAVSHDLKAPLRNINALINWIKEDNQDTFDESTNESFDIVLFNVEKMDNLIKGILDYSSIDKIESINAKLDLNELVSECLRSVLIPTNFGIIVPPNFPTIYGNAYRIKQIFQNLIQNSVLYNQNENPKIEIGFTENENQFEFYVKDNGEGIKEEYQEKIFNSFIKLHNNFNSSGLGLSIVKKIVESLGGKIWVQSEENQGATFYFTIIKDNGTA
jgi:signal transduction histidine kinase